MYIECLIRREGNTHLTIAGFDYVFVKNEHGRSVCQVHSSAHQDHLLSLKDFIPYEPPEEPEPELELEDEAPEEEEEETQTEDTEGLILNGSGEPFATEAAAKRARTKMGEDDLEIMPYENGYALQRL